MKSPLYFLIHRDTALECVQAVTSGHMIIGRGESSEIWLAGNSVSRRHARIVVNSQFATIEDLNSRNGTLVNDQIIRGTIELHEQDVIRVADYRLVVFYSIEAVIRKMSHLEQSTWTGCAAAAEGEQQNLRGPALTPAQRRVLEGFVSGMQEKEVAARLKLSIHTIHTHAKAIYKAFNISSRAELLCRCADQQGRRDALPPVSARTISASDR